MNTTLMLIIELLGGVTSLFAAGCLFARVTGYDVYYDEMLYDQDLQNKEENNNGDDDFIHRISF